MRVLVVHAHPVETSFNRALYNAAIEALTSAGHQVDALDLYEEGFQAVMSRDERLRYHDIPDNLTPAVKPYVDRLMAAEGAVLAADRLEDAGVLDRRELTRQKRGIDGAGDEQVRLRVAWDRATAS